METGKEFNLSDNIFRIPKDELYQENHYLRNLNLIDMGAVKEFIRRLKEWNKVMFKESLMLKPILQEIDKLAGDALK